MKYWCDNSPIWTHYMNALSILFPAWERAFVSVINKRLLETKDPELILRMKQFVQEELSHANAHEAFNTRHNLKDLEMAEFKKAKTIHRKPEMKMWVGVMVSIEHIAACMSRPTIDKWGHCKGKDYKLFCWHAKEELGHKSLAVDLWRYLGYSDKDLRKIARVNQKYVMKFLIGYTLSKTYSEGQFKRLSVWKDTLMWGAFVVMNVLIPMLSIYLPKFHPDNTNDEVYLNAV